MSETNEPVPIMQIIEATANTVSNPNPEQIVADIQLALKLFLEFKDSLNKLHPSALGVIKFLL